MEKLPNAKQWVQNGGNLLQLLLFPYQKQLRADNGIFFFTPDGKYIEWSGDYLYSDIPFEVKSPVLTIAVGGN